MKAYINPMIAVLSLDGEDILTKSVVREVKALPEIDWNSGDIDWNHGSL